MPTAFPTRALTREERIARLEQIVESLADELAFTMQTVTVPVTVTPSGSTLDPQAKTITASVERVYHAKRRDDEAVRQEDEDAHAEPPPANATGPR